MKLLYTHENKIIVENAKNCVQEEGIESVMKNEFSAGGMGELSPMETWPELWVNDSDFDRAEKIIYRLINTPLGDSWTCTNCNEKNESSFEICWNCQAEPSRLRKES